jgi:hypothetical protein
MLSNALLGKAQRPLMSGMHSSRSQEAAQRSTQGSARSKSSRPSTFLQEGEKTLATSRRPENEQREDCHYKDKDAIADFHPTAPIEKNICETRRLSDHIG